MMIPTAISGTVGNFRRGNVDLPAAALIGVAAITTTALGAWIAHDSSTRFWANVLFAIFLVFIAVQIAVRTIRAQPQDRSGPSEALGRIAGCQ